MTRSPRAYTVRAARVDELPALLEVIVSAFGERVRPRMHAQLFQDAGHLLHQSRLAEVGGVPASYVRVSHRPIYYGEAMLPMGGIGAVSTHPDYRGLGLSSAILEDSIAYMRGQGYLLSVLFTGIPGFYARLGWVPFPTWRWQAPLPTDTAPLAQAPAIDSTVRPFDEERDLSAVREIYAAYNAPHALAAVRDTAYWQDDHTRFLGILPHLVVEQADHVVAYASTRSQEGRYRVYEAGCLPNHQSAFKPLATSLLAEAYAAGATEIETSLGRGHGLTAALRDLPGLTGHDEIDYHAMLLLLDLPGLLRAALPALQARLTARPLLHGKRGAFGFRIAGQYARLLVRHGLVRVDGAPAKRTLDLPQGLFWRLFLGASALPELVEELATLTAIHLSTEEEAMLSTLFPPRSPAYYWPDHF